jgi:hypothetical protein
VRLRGTSGNWPAESASGTAVAVSVVVLLVVGKKVAVGAADAAEAAVAGTWGTSVAVGDVAGAAPHAASTNMSKVSTIRNSGLVIANLVSHIDIRVSRRSNE